MREYGVVSPMFWVGETGRALRKNPNAQRVAIYLMTAPSSEMTGVFYCPLSSILNDVGIFEAPSNPLLSPSEGGSEGVWSPLKGVKQAILDLIDLDFCFYDFESEFVFVKEMAKWQIGESLKERDNRVAGLRKFVKSMPKPMAALFLERYNEDFCLGFDLQRYSELPNEKPSPLQVPSKPLTRGSIEPLRSQEQEQEQEYINTNKQQTEVCNEEPAREDDVCSVSSYEDNFSEDEVIDAPVKVQIEHAQLQNLDKIEDEKKPLTLVELITACKTFGIKLGHTQKTETIANRKTVNLVVLRECVKAWKGTNTGTGYFIGILENASKDPNSILPHEKREKPEPSAETITDKQAGYFASRLVKDVSFQTTFGVGHQSFDTFIDQVTQRLHDPEYFKEYMPWMRKLGFISTDREAV
ncbi:hypothetical protein [Parasutterella secunda]|uniref:hypothetical protein n=1 Tax=Parasutterella secunda TaxID=626947 RepID=UPI0025A443DC|nr:hypothetical protein [Parasutterella secunda]MDM8227737.1 hypothetical protein [Parasutterella secunda]